MIELLASDDQILRNTCKPVEDFPIDSDLIEGMFNLMVRHSGCGLAAPQFGLDARLFVIERSGKRNVFVNPKILEFGKDQVEMIESCLSLPNIFGSVSRPKKIKVEYQDESGKIRKACFEGLMSRIFQHELDHLNGILFIDRVSP